MAKQHLFLLAGVLSLSSCNLWGGIDSPSGDDQILSAARGCLDRGDYECATENYAKLSADSNDTRLAETALLAMAQDGIFSTQDLIKSLGSSRGNAASFSLIAGFIAERGKTQASYRITLDRLFVETNAIVNPQLRNYTQFLIALAMTNQILAAAAVDSELTAGDISSNPTGCRTNPAACGDPGGLADNTPGVPTTWTGTATDSNWGDDPSVDMIITAAAVAQTKFNAISGASGGQGIISALGELAGITGAADVKRQTLLTTLFP